MENLNQNSDKYQSAKNRVEEIKGFYGNFISFCVAMAFLIFINLNYSPKQIWFHWPFLGWGLGVFLHAMKVYNFIPFLGKEWEEKKINQYLNQAQTRKNK